jgi:hypothetical protein
MFLFLAFLYFPMYCFNTNKFFGGKDMKKRRIIPFSVMFILVLICVMHSGFGMFGGAMRSRTKPKPLINTAAQDQLKQLVKDLEHDKNALPTETFWPAALLRRLNGHGPQELFEWVRGNTVWVAYKGSLRGAQGVLMDHMGNSLDRSLLLAELLEKRGHTVRLAHRVLTKEQANTLVPQIKSRQAFKRVTLNGQGKYDSEKLTKQAQRAQVSDTDLQNMLQSVKRVHEESNTGVTRTINDQLLMLDDVFKIVATQEDELNAQLMAGLRDHWWVQYQSKNGWVDFDLMLPDGKTEAAGFVPEETLKLQKLPEKLMHRVAIRFVVEQCKNGVLTEHTVLEHELVPSALLGKSITLLTYPLHWPNDFGTVKNDELPQKMKQLILDEDEWLPVLQVGADMYAQSSFTTAGMVNTHPMESAVASVGKATGGLFGAAGGGMGGGSQSHKPDENSVLTAAWIEYRIYSAEDDQQIIRREVFDLINEEVRKSGTCQQPDLSNDRQLERGYCLYSIVEILPLVCKLSPQFVTYTSFNNLTTELKQVLTMLADSRNSARKDFHVSVMTAAEWLQTPLYKWALLRDSFSSSDALYMSSINIINKRTRLAQDTEGALVLRQIIDIVTNRIAINPEFFEKAVRIRIEQGVIDTIAETLVLPGNEPHINTPYLMTCAKQQGISWRTVTEKSSSSWNHDFLTDKTRSLINQTLSDGWAVIVPEKPVLVAGKPRFGWWRVDPKTGETVGVMDTGFHQDTAEYTYTPSQWAIIRRKCIDAINTLHRSVNPLGPKPGSWPPNMSFSEFLKMMNYQNWKYLDPEAMLNLWQLSRISGALAGL